MIKCRSCLSDNVYSIIPLGDTPLANSITATPDNDCPRYNLEVMLCSECGLAQLKDLVDPKELFSNYVYFSSNSETMLKSAKSLVDTIIPSLSKESLVVEIASNDGYLLKNYVENNIKVLGIDPAENIAELANKSGINTLCDFFSYNLSKTLASKDIYADVIHANNVMAHVPNINDFIKGIKKLLKPKGYAVIEVPYLLDLVSNLEFDTIYHEHVYYFALKPLISAFERHSLEIYNLNKLDIHGGTLRLFVGHSGAHNVHQVINEYLNIEDREGLFDLERYKVFMNQVYKLKKELNNKLRDVSSSGGRIAAYGASAKGTTLLNTFDVSHYIDFVVDRSTAKQGKYTPGTSLIINDPSWLLKNNVSHAVLLTWNFAKEILEQQSEFIEKGGKFILPLPEVKEIS